jgi:hydroxypyruvate reductase
MQGEAHAQAKIFAAALKSVRPDTSPTLLLAGGETTLEVVGQGKGGRNQQFALAVAQEIADTDGIAVLASGTDGTDGPTDAAGAFVDSTTWERAAALGLSPSSHLQNNDAYPLFEQLGDLFITGPTGTNVMDIVIGIVTVRHKRTEVAHAD